MENFTGRLIEEMDARIKRAYESVLPDMEIFKACFEVTDKTMQDLKAFITAYEFHDKSEEIKFFKEIKPHIHKHFIYYAELLYIEAEKPTGDRGGLIKYYKSVIERNKIFQDRNKLLYAYHRLGRDREDVLLYLRGADTNPLFPGDRVDLDQRFCTVNSSLLAKLLAFDMVNAYYAALIERLKGNRVDFHGSSEFPKLQWTASQADLVELVYALQASGSLNNGQASIKDIATVLQQILNVSIGNLYRVFSDISIRKKARTAFMDSLKANLERRMDDVL